MNIAGTSTDGYLTCLYRRCQRTSATSGDTGGVCLCKIGYTPASVPPTIIHSTYESVDHGWQFDHLQCGRKTFRRLSYQWFLTDFDNPID